MQVACRWHVIKRLCVVRHNYQLKFCYWNNNSNYTSSFIIQPPPYLSQSKGFYSKKLWCLSSYIQTLCLLWLTGVISVLCLQTTWTYCMSSKISHLIKPNTQFCFLSAGTPELPLSVASDTNRNKPFLTSLPVPLTQLINTIKSWGQQHSYYWGRRSYTPLGFALNENAWKHPHKAAVSISTITRAAQIQTSIIMKWVLPVWALTKENSRLHSDQQLFTSGCRW